MGNRLIRYCDLKSGGMMVVKNAFCTPSVSPMKTPYKPNNTQAAVAEPATANP